MTRAWVDLLRDSGGLTELYNRVPSLQGVGVSSVHFDQVGPTLTLRVVLPVFPDRPRPEWEADGCDRFECQVRFLAIEDVRMRGWRLPVTADVLITSAEPEEHNRITVEIQGRDASMELHFTSNASLGVGHMNAYREGAESRHYTGRVDGLRYRGRLPEPSEVAFFEHL
ncbi:Imm50 family immunity protein [Streptomyces sp. CBMA29]|uniref:Imm50 family immunity protein n=1 Tax=Streptomyces sp. CBMA29 TaxID=1896314 RepID=UPI001661A270|nr:Imm50 family immunity protein [Streptomyces sp. CBMA29]MBD0735727.1 hypothetical protein [Streptomyces sp. CBMA29]